MFFVWKGVGRILGGDLYIKLVFVIQSRALWGVIVYSVKQNKNIIMMI